MKRFTARENEVVQLLLRGHTNRQIGLALGVSEKTAKNYMSVILQKLEVNSRLQAYLAVQVLIKEADNVEA